MSDVEAQPVAFNRVHGLLPADRRPYNLIVEGRGQTLIRERDGRAAAGEKSAEDGRAESDLARRYFAGAALLEALNLPTAMQAAASSEKPSVVLLPSRTARTMTIVFSGNNPEFALPAHLLIAHDTHLLLIHDRRRCFALAGIPGLGTDYAECVQSLMRIQEKLAPDSLHILGISAGGAGAIKFASDLQATQLVCFSVPTTLNLDDDPGAELKHYPQLTKLYRHDRSLGIDLAAYYDGYVDRPNAIFVYSEGHPRDSWLALRMSGIRGVTLLPTEGYTGHTTYRWLLTENKIAPYLDMLYPGAVTSHDMLQPGDTGTAASVMETTAQLGDDRSPIYDLGSRSPGLLRDWLPGRLQDQFGSD